MPFAPFKTVVQPGPLLKKYKKATKHEVFVIANTEQDLTSRVRVAFKISPGVDLQYFLVFKDSQEPQSVEAKRVLEAAQACLHNITSPEALDWKALLEQPEAQGFTFLVDVADRAALGLEAKGESDGRKYKGNGGEKGAGRHQAYLEVNNVVKTVCQKVLARCKPDDPNQGAMYRMTDPGYNKILEQVAYYKILIDLRVIKPRVDYTRKEFNAWKHKSLSNMYNRLEKDKVFSKLEYTPSATFVEDNKTMAEYYNASVFPVLEKGELPEQYKEWIARGKKIEAEMGLEEQEPAPKKRRSRMLLKRTTVREADKTADSSGSEDDNVECNKEDAPESSNNPLAQPDASLPPGMRLPKGTGTPLRQAEEGEAEEDGAEEEDNLTAAQRVKRQRLAAVAQIKAAAAKKQAAEATDKRQAKSTNVVSRKRKV